MLTWTYLIRLSGGSFEVEQIFGTVVNEPLSRLCRAVVLRGITNGNALSVGGVDNGTIGSSHHTLCLAIQVPVVSRDVNLVVLKVTHIPSAVDPPQSLASELIGFDDGIGGIAGVRMVELHDELQLSVTIEVSRRGIVGNEGAGERPMVGLDLYPWIHLGCHGSTLFLCHATHHGLHGIGGCSRAALVGIVGDRERLIIEFGAVTIDVIGHIIVLLSEDTPAAENSRGCLHSHQTSVDFVHCTLGKYRRYCQQRNK